MYNRRTWLNPLSISSTSSIVTFDGDVEYSDATYRDTFIKISDCKGSIKLHKRDPESMESFIDKIKLLRDELDLFIDHLENK